VADAAGVNGVTAESGEGGIRVVWGNGNEKTTGRLWIEEEILIFGGDARFEFRALADESAIIF